MADDIAVAAEQQPAKKVAVVGGGLVSISLNTSEYIFLFIFIHGLSLSIEVLAVLHRKIIL